MSLNCTLKNGYRGQFYVYFMLRIYKFYITCTIKAGDGGVHWLPSDTDPSKAQSSFGY